MHSFRVTKYDPALRDARGAYTRDDWHLFSHVGLVFGGQELTLAEYQRTEASYTSAAAAFLSEAGVHELLAVGVENAHGHPEAPREGSTLPLPRFERCARAVLRELYWCRFEAPGAFVHFGWDFYMYVGVPTPCPLAARAAAEAGLFVEPFVSPYRT